MTEEPTVSPFTEPDVLSKGSGEDDLLDSYSIMASMS